MSAIDSTASTSSRHSSENQYKYGHFSSRANLEKGKKTTGVWLI